MRAHSQKRIGALLIWGITTALVTWWIAADGLRDFEMRTWDWRLQFISSKKPHNPNIKLIMVDQTSLDHFSRREKIFWPWPRSLYVPVLKFLERAGAKAAAFDILFTESSGQVEDDQEFAAAMRGALPVVNSVVLRSDTDAQDIGEENLLRAKQEPQAARIELFLRNFATRNYGAARVPIPEIFSASQALGSVTAESDSDRIFRSTVPGAYMRRIPILNLPFALFNQTHPESARATELGSSANSQGRLFVRFFGPAGTYDTYSIHAIISSWLLLEEGRRPVVPLDSFKDSYVFIGANAPGLLDLRSVPVGGAYSGVEVNATILDNVLGKSFLRQAPRWLSCIAAALLLASVCFITIFVPRHQLVVLCGVFGVWVVGVFYAAILGWWIPLVAPVCGAALAVLVGFFLQYQLEGKQHKFIRGAFQHFVTAEVVNKIIADPSLLSLGGERKELTMFFSDIRGFTTLSENMAPATLVKFINTFLTEMTDVILSLEGTIDKYEGDAIIAFWNAPLTIHDHQDRAVRAALLCQRRLHELRDFFQTEFGVDIQMRVGVNTGVVTVGNFGSTKRFNYTMIGDAANLASRLEGVNKVFGTTVLVSEETKMAVASPVAWRRVGDAQVKGKLKATRLFEPLDPQTQGDTIAGLDLYNRGLEAFERGSFKEAERCFERLTSDPVSAAYIARIHREDSTQVEWSPVWVLTEK